jgi:hypothetical protein
MGWDKIEELSIRESILNKLMLWIIILYYNFYLIFCRKYDALSKIYWRIKGKKIKNQNILYYQI